MVSDNRCVSGLHHKQTFNLKMNFIQKFYYLMFLVVASFFSLLFLDFFVGGYLIPCSERTHLDHSRCVNPLRISHPIYHHGLAANFHGHDSWGPIKYSMCTDDYGFKISCNRRSSSNFNYDLVFMGDSFTEGIGLEYEETFVGQISKELPSLKIANVGVSSYAPSIYLAKTKHLIEKGIRFKELIVYIDISDIQDEALFYRYEDSRVVNKITEGVASYKKFLRWAFPLTYFGLHEVRTKLINKPENQPVPNPLSKEFSRGSWTYDPQAIGYGSGGVQGGIDQAIRHMQMLSDELVRNGISLSVAIYPWPQQILYDQSDSRQVRIWQEFCKNRCLRFINSFDTYFSLKDKSSPKAVVDTYFISGDMHHNQQGAGILARDFLKSYSR